MLDQKVRPNHMLPSRNPLKIDINRLKQNDRDSGAGQDRVSKLHSITPIECNYKTWAECME